MYTHQPFCTIASVLFVALLATASPTPPNLNETQALNFVNGTDILFSRGAAPPYPDACITSENCAYGYKCFKGTCIWGCNDNTDCLAPTYCTYCHPCGNFATNCMINWHRPCGRHLAFCKWNEQCCSGICGKLKSARRCLPRYRDGRDADAVGKEVGETEETGQPG